VTEKVGQVEEAPREPRREDFIRGDRVPDTNPAEFEWQCRTCGVVLVGEFHPTYREHECASRRESAQEFYDAHVWPIKMARQAIADYGLAAILEGHPELFNPSPEVIEQYRKGLEAEDPAAAERSRILEVIRQLKGEWEGVAHSMAKHAAWDDLVKIDARIAALDELLERLGK
jgi:hypothetical protein